jgi:hypothetical protein
MWGRSLEKITVTLGAHNIKEREQEQVRQKIPKNHVLAHPKIDAALIRILNSITYSLAIQPINLPQLMDENQDFAGYDATASGWGINCEFP